MENVAPYLLPESWRQQIGREKLLFLPHEYAPAMGEDRYSLVMLPTFQLYSAYLPALDAVCAERLSGVDSPRWIVCSIDPIWSGNLVGYPATWTALLYAADVTAF